MNLFPPRRILLQTGVLCGLLLVLVACSTQSSGQIAHAKSLTPTVAPTPIPTLNLGPQTCPVSVQNTDYWNSLIPTQPGTSQVEKITCGHLKGDVSLQALITARSNGDSSMLDVYIYDNITNAAPVQIFKLQNLYQGNAKISAENTLLTAEVDLNSSANINQPATHLTQDLCREFKWSPSIGTLVQIAFPGFFPDLTRYQAEADQSEVQQGQQVWKMDARSTSLAFATMFLKWQQEATSATIVSGGSPEDQSAVVMLKSSSKAGNGITLTLNRLEDNIKNIWIVTAVQTSGVSIISPQSLDLLTSPTTISGTGFAFEGVIGTISVLDHLDNNLGQAQVHGAIGNGSTTFSSSITYQRSFTTGEEEGLLMLSEPSNADGSIVGATFAKVLLG